jgi:hypothetical protein
VAFSQPAANKGVRAATAKEIADAGYPEGTAAQVDAHGKFVNLKTPPAGGANGKPKVDPLTAFNAGFDGLDELHRSFEDAAGDTDGRSNITGVLGQHAYQYLPAGKDYMAKLKKLDAQKMTELAKQMAGTGAFNRITNMEAQQLPKTLAAIQPGMSDDGIQAQFDTGRGQLARSQDAMIAEGIRHGYVAQNPKTGAIVRFNGASWVPVKRYGAK